MYHIFPILVLLLTTLKLYLNYRQKNAVKNNRTKVPIKFVSSISLSEHQKSADYTLAKLKFNNIKIIIDGMILIMLTSCGLIQYLDNIIIRYYPSLSIIFQGILLIGTIGLLGFIIDTPFDLYHTFILEERFGFNKTTAKIFILDNIKTVVLSVILGAPLLYLIFWLMQIMGNLWWIWVWSAFCGFNILIMFIYPTVIAPLFNKFLPLNDKTLEEKIYALLNKCGFKSSGIFVMDGSKRSGHGNAYFTGIGKNKRIVFFDTLIKQLTPDEIEAVLAHELGHFKKKHIIKQIGVSFSMLLAMLYLLSVFIHEPVFYNMLGVTHMTNYNALILISIALGVVSFPFTPLMSYMSRKNEFEADDYAKQISNKNHLIAGLVKLYKENSSTLTPDDLYAKFYYSHPPASIRIAHLELDSNK